jgi:uncharacterized protein YbbK (DUF523 family)
MDKNSEENDIKDAVIIKRSPSTGVTNRKQIIDETEELRQSMNKKLNILSKWLRESEQIMPRPKR